MTQPYGSRPYSDREFAAKHLVDDRQHRLQYLRCGVTSLARQQTLDGLRIVGLRQLSEQRQDRLQTTQIDSLTLRECPINGGSDLDVG